MNDLKLGVRARGRGGRLATASLDPIKIATFIVIKALLSPWKRASVNPLCEATKPRRRPEAERNADLNTYPPQTTERI